MEAKKKLFEEKPVFQFVGKAERQRERQTELQPGFKTKMEM